ncbi:MAG: 3-isopropylmalate dehydratase large subunit [Anaerolineales bacterium]|nr:3-isopropylmalate dehydratase large subunit [Anaerolineales bacterium]
MSSPKTLFDKIWDRHIVTQEPDFPAVLYIDLHLVHEVTSPQAFTGLYDRGLSVRRPEQTFATMDHAIPTLPRHLPVKDAQAAAQLEKLKENCQKAGIELFGMDSDRNGIVHVIGPELGLTQPGQTIVCGDSHTSTHGAFGALAFGIGTSEVEHVLATQCLLQSKPQSFEVRFEGILQPGVSAKDMVLAFIRQVGVGGGSGYVIEYRGSAIEQLDMESRMTICNMSIEAGARAGIISPDETTYAYLKGRPYAPDGKDWDTSVLEWKKLPTEEGARFDKSISIDVTELEPMITFGTNPGMGMPITGTVPDPARDVSENQRDSLVKALQYMDLMPGQQLLGKDVDIIFLGSCTNSRMNDLRQAASILRGKKISPDVRMLVVPGSQPIKRQAEEEGLAAIFQDAGAEWRESGCSMCIAMNGDQLKPGEYSISTSNRNFEGRQGPGGRTFLASPLTSAASALTGKVTDVRTVLSHA